MSNAGPFRSLAYVSSTSFVAYGNRATALSLVSRSKQRRPNFFLASCRSTKYSQRTATHGRWILTSSAVLTSSMLSGWTRGFAFAREKNASIWRWNVSTTDYLRLKRERRTPDHWKFQSVKRPVKNRYIWILYILSHGFCRKTNLVVSTPATFPFDVVAIDLCLVFVWRMIRSTG